MNPPQMHFPWQRLSMSLISDAILLWIFYTYKDWLYYFAEMQSPNAGTAITAMSAAAGILFVCVAGIQIWFITGSTKSLETIMRFSAVASSVASVAAETVNQTENITERIFNCDKLDPKDLDDQAFAE